MQNFKSRVFSTVSHDIRTPLALILGPTERLLRSARLAPDQKQELEMVVRNARALLRYADELQQRAAQEAGESTMTAERVSSAAIQETTLPPTNHVVSSAPAAGAMKERMTGERSLVLVIEDNPDMNRFITTTLAGEYQVATAYNGREGLEKFRTLRPDLVISDIAMPEMTGGEFVQEVRRHPEWDQIPIVLLTANADEKLRVKFLREGVQDYLMKPFNAEELLARAANLLSIKLRAELHVEEETRDLVEANIELQRLATTDALTGIANRRRIMDLALQALADAQRRRQSLSLFVFDIDRFKSINDQYGHEAGDRTLVAVAQTAAKLIRPTDAVGRIGGEEFLVLMPDTTSDEAVSLAERLRREVAVLAIDSNGHRIGVTVSIGVAAIKATNRAENLRPLISRADTALYQAKTAGRNRISVAS